MLRHLRPAAMMILVFTLLTGVAAPLGITAIASLALPYQAGGSMVSAQGRVVGSALIGQNFSAPQYFSPRPTALTVSDPRDSTKTIPNIYDASKSGASNLAPSAKTLIARVRADADTYGGHDIPADALTTSGSGLDPDISPQNARRQAVRVAAARHMPLNRVLALISAQTEGPALGLFGAPRVNVLRLNLSLDRAQGDRG